MDVLPIHIDKEIDPSDNLVDLILHSGILLDGDVLVLAQKIISKHEGRVVRLSSVMPSLLAEGLGSQYQKDPRLIELILQESKKIVRIKNGIIIVETNNGFICANAGIDESNVPHGYATLLPIDSDHSAELIRKEILKKTGKSTAVLISDTFGRPFRLGQTNFAIGISGLSPICDYVGTMDSFGKVLRVTEIAVADELCAAAELVMKKASYCPAVVIRNYKFSPTTSSINQLIRNEKEDLFR